MTVNHCGAIRLTTGGAGLTAPHGAGGRSLLPSPRRSRSLLPRHPSDLVATGQQGDAGQHEPLGEDVRPALDEQDGKDREEDVPEC